MPNLLHEAAAEGAARRRASGIGSAGLSCLALALASACATAPVAPAPGARGGGGSRAEVGLASYYHDALHGRATASGQPYDREAATCAHRSHRFGTLLQVTVVDTGRSVRCRVNDRGPFVKGRVVDVSKALARELGLIERGLARVRVVPVE